MRPRAQAIQRGFVTAYDLLLPVGANGVGRTNQGDASSPMTPGEREVMRVFPDALVEPAI